MSADAFPKDITLYQGRYWRSILTPRELKAMLVLKTKLPIPSEARQAIDISKKIYPCH